MKTRHPLRRFILASLALAAFAGPAAASGCSVGFAPISQVDGLRVFAVVADKPYARPGDAVTFHMTYDAPGSAAPPQIVWFGGCFDPDGDAYYNCYPQLASVFQGFDPTHLPPGLVGVGDSFTLDLPADLISSRPKPNNGQPYYGVAFVFFAVCEGTLGPAPIDDAGTGLAGSFPLGCFGPDGKALGADSFVPGYTQVYAFADGRMNLNPTFTDEGLTLTNASDDAAVDVDAGDAGVTTCSVPADERLGPSGCGRPDPFQACTEYQLSVHVPADVAEVDPDGKTTDGRPLNEVVWVDYFADQGNIDSPVLLINDATTGLQPAYATNWVAPPTPGKVNFWAVVHDSRGGEAVIQTSVDVQ